ncbi:hypothetical protein [Nocardia sp. SYP-A9097]|uniref:hypothetical protein n=1 Tax=Nocardia sp. SYP-A9097 TaxID=2663237 RepID=UPI00129B5D86|nr:hypothetical protein [Nocardia sp. SYP-A9097]
MDKTAADSFEGIHGQLTTVREHLADIQVSLAGVKEAQNEHSQMLQEISSRLPIKSDQ